eukprot:7789641-Pyramimonas_sp.AAC.1
MRQQGLPEGSSRELGWEHLAPLPPIVRAGRTSAHLRGEGGAEGVEPLQAVLHPILGAGGLGLEG